MPHPYNNLPERYSEPPDPTYHFADCDVCGAETHEMNFRTNVLNQDVCPDCEDKFYCDYCSDPHLISDIVHNRYTFTNYKGSETVINDHICLECYYFELNELYM
jgi:hypothetical protein